MDAGASPRRSPARVAKAKEPDADVILAAESQSMAPETPLKTKVDRLAAKNRAGGTDGRAVAVAAASQSTGRDTQRKRGLGELDL
jgi:hypothetical protein